MPIFEAFKHIEMTPLIHVQKIPLIYVQKEINPPILFIKSLTLRHLNCEPSPLKNRWGVFKNFDPKKGGSLEILREKRGVFENFYASVQE